MSDDVITCVKCGGPCYVPEEQKLTYKFFGELLYGPPKHEDINVCYRNLAVMEDA